MIFHRLWLPLLVAGCLLPGLVLAQDNAGGAGAAGSAAGGSAAGSAAGNPGTGSPDAGSAPGASSAFGAAPSAPSTGATPSNPNQGAVPNGTQNPQGQGVPGTQNGQPTPDNTTAGGSASAFGSTEKPNSQLQPAPASFSVPGFYGRGGQTFTVGQGRLARPKFRFTGNVAVGYDDNVFQTPTHGISVPDQKVQVLQTPGTPESQLQVLVPSGNPLIPDSVQTVHIPAVAPKFRTVNVPGVTAPERVASWITRTDAKWDVQMANRRTLFTFDIGGGVDYYWNRPGKKADYTGNLSLIYLRKLTGRAQFTVAIDAAYQSQPDFSQINQPTSNNVGSYLSTNIKADLSYRLTPRFSTVTSVNYSSINYEQSTSSNNNYGTTTFGTELRYLFSPRVTLVGELRYASDLHANDSALDTKTYYFLLGADVALSKRFNATLRVGEVVQRFSESNSQQSSPYVETSLNYRVTPQTNINWNARYGYEESGEPDASNLVARTGLQVTQIFTPRLQAVLSTNLIRSETKFHNTNALTNLDSVQNTIDASAGLYYTYDRHWSFNLTYSYTTVLGPESFDDYFRQRVFLGAAYQF